MRTTASRNATLISMVLLAIGATVGCSGGGGGGSNAVPSSLKAGAVAPSQQTPTPDPAAYSVTSIGTLAGLNAESDAYGINDAGTVVGRSIGSTSSMPYMEAISFSNGDLVGLGGLPGYSGSLANAINSHGTVAGAVFFPGNAVLGSSIAVTFDSQGVHNLGALPCFGPNDQLVATAINANGDVVGWGNTNGTVEAMLFRGGRIIDLGAGYAVGINDSGEIVGYTSSAHAAIFSTSGPPNIIESLGTSSDANAVNNKGQIVGGFQTGAVVGNTSIQHAFIYNNGQMKDLGVPAGGISSSALAINDQGVVVGQWWDSSGQTHAFIDSNGVMVDLQTLIPSGSGWTLDGAAGINNNGDIVGNGTTNGAVRGYLLEPTHSGG